MKIKTIVIVLLPAVILAACAPSVTVPAPTGTAVPVPTSTPIPATVTATPTLPPGGPLSAEGPWLLYVHNSPGWVYGGVGVPAEFVLLNQDGSGRTSITVPECDSRTVNSLLIDAQNSPNYMAQYEGSDGGIYLLRPSDATGMLVYRMLWFSMCNTFFNGEEKNGLLASTYRPANEAVPELMIYELPDGKIRDRLPLVRCAPQAKVCEENREHWYRMGEQEPRWSPNGRYLAFAAVLDADSSDLFIYDTQNGSLRRLTSGPDWVGPIEWSPDGTQIIMGELPRIEEYFLGPSSTSPSSYWSVSVSNTEIKFLYDAGDASSTQYIEEWLDDKRFIAYEGQLVDANVAHDLRLVDTGAGTSRLLYDGDFTAIEFVPRHEIFMLYQILTPKYPQGYHLVSMRNSSILYLEGPPYLSSFPYWDEKTGLFVSRSDDCETDAHSSLAIDYLGNFTCVPKPTPTPTPAVVETPRYPAPDGKSVVSLKDGTWLETQGEAAVQISPETAAEVLWCPDASCFFFFTPQQDNRWSLYRVSMPDLNVKIMDEGIESIGSARWLGGEK